MNSKKKGYNDPDELIEEITMDANGEDEQLWAFRQVIEDEVPLPADGFVIGEPVSVVEIDYDGNERRGLTAKCLREDGSEHVISASDVVFPEMSVGERYIAAYRRWLGLDAHPWVSTGETKTDLESLQDIPPWSWPEEAGKMLQGILQDNEADASDRLLAAELAGDSTAMDDELLDVLLSILQSSNESEDMRAKAVISMGSALEYADEDIFDDGFDDGFDDQTISEEMFNRIKKTLRKLYRDAGVPKEVRRRILESSVRAPQDWHADAVRAAYLSDDEGWKLTAIFCMQFVRGFNDQILEALDSKDPNIHYHAVCAAGNWGVDAAWPHIAAILNARESDKDLLLAAIEAAANIRPQEAAEILLDLTGSEDEDIVEAAYEAMAMAELPWDEDDDDETFH